MNTIYTNGANSFMAMSAGEILIDLCLLALAMWITIKVAKA